LMRHWLPTAADVLIVLGLAAVSTGAGLVYVPAGVISAGVGLLALGLVKEKGGR
jgi:hypothetical protein